MKYNIILLIWNQNFYISDQFDEDEDDENSKQCIFCLEQDDKFIEQQDEKDGMDMHYWKECPMLTKCKECKMVIEISGYK